IPGRSPAPDATLGRCAGGIRDPRRRKGPEGDARHPPRLRVDRRRADRRDEPRRIAGPDVGARAAYLGGSGGTDGCRPGRTRTRVLSAPLLARHADAAGPFALGARAADAFSREWRDHPVRYARSGERRRQLLATIERAHGRGPTI